MRAKPGNLENLIPFFDTDKDFELTKEELEKQTGGILSTNLYYIKNKSSLAKMAKEKGYTLEVKPVEIKPMKIYFKREK